MSQKPDQSKLLLVAAVLLGVMSVIFIVEAAISPGVGAVFSAAVFTLVTIAVAVKVLRLRSDPEQ